MQKGNGLEERIPLFAARCVNVCEAIPAKRLKAGHFNAVNAFEIWRDT